MTSKFLVGQQFKDKSREYQSQDGKVHVKFRADGGISLIKTGTGNDVSVTGCTVVINGIPVVWELAFPSRTTGTIPKTPESADPQEGSLTKSKREQAEIEKRIRRGSQIIRVCCILSVIGAIVSIGATLMSRHNRAEHPLPAEVSSGK
jgi:hypothetical protein